MWDYIIPVNYKWTSVWTVDKATHCGHTFVKIKDWFINYQGKWFNIDLGNEEIN